MTCNWIQIPKKKKRKRKGKEKKGKERNECWAWIQMREGERMRDVNDLIGL